MQPVKVLSSLLVHFPEENSIGNSYKAVFRFTSLTGSLQRYAAIRVRVPTDEVAVRMSPRLGSPGGKT